MVQPAQPPLVDPKPEKYCACISISYSIVYRQDIFPPLRTSRHAASTIYGWINQNIRVHQLAEVENDT